MNREILFRGKRVDTGEWVYGNLIYDKDTYRMGIVDGYLNEYKHVQSGTIGQHAGLKDKNGKMIFEKDIVTFGQREYSIVFECGSFALCDKDGLMIAKIGGLNDYCYPLMTLYLECCWEEDSAYDIEVIGNVHDNPELLEEQP